MTEKTLTPLLPPSNSLHLPLHLPFDLVVVILCRLPVKFLLQLRCVCKSWNSLISEDSNFTRKHLQLSTSNLHRHHLNFIGNLSGPLDFPMSSVFNSVSTKHAMQLWYPPIISAYSNKVTTCDGMLCFKVSHSLALLCNPSIRKYKIMPPFKTPGSPIFNLVYDRFTHNYKIIAVIFDSNNKNEVNIHALGTDYWRKIQDLPYNKIHRRPGTFVSDTVNWLVYDRSRATKVIVSLDLEKESYQTLCSPHDMQFNIFNTLGVLRDCLCILYHSHRHKFSDIWIMKEYGNEQSWTKLLSIPHMEDGIYYDSKALYISKDDQLILEFHLKKGRRKSLLIYDSKNNTSKISEIQNINNWMTSNIYVESLMSPFVKS